MKTIFISSVIAFLFTANAVSAYLPENMRSYQLDDRSAVFALEYTFGSETRETKVPVLGSLTPNDTEFGFAVRNNGLRTRNIETAFGFTLADAPIVDGMYTLPPGVSALFTSYMVVVLPEEAPERNLSIIVEQLPLYLNGTNFPLNEFQLQYYVTPEVTIP